jgi:hypothetical protein
MNKYNDHTPSTINSKPTNTNSLSTLKVSPRPNHNPYSLLETMPEKQKKQIEFIDEIYNKVVLSSNTHTDNIRKPMSTNYEDKENLGHSSSKRPLTFQNHGTAYHTFT